MEFRGDLGKAQLEFENFVVLIFAEDAKIKWTCMYSVGPERQTSAHVRLPLLRGHPPHVGMLEG